MQLINALGLNVKILIAQLINFAILFFILYRFAYKPILAILHERQERIEKGIKDSESASKKLEEISRQEKKVLSDAREEAHRIIKLAEDTANKNKDDIITSAKEESLRIIAETKKQIEQEKRQMFDEVRKEISVLVIKATEAVLHEKIDETKDRELIRNAVEKLQ